MARYSEEQWKEFKFKLTLLVIVVVVGGAIAAAGPGLEPIFLKRALAQKEQPWAPRWIFNVAKVMEWTFRSKRAKEIYENEFYWNYRGNEAQEEGLARLAEEIYPNHENPEHFRYFLHWQVLPYLTATDEEKRKQPEWVGGEFAKPHPLMAKVLNRVAKMYEERRDYLPMRHIHRAVQRCFKDVDPQAWAENEEAIKRDSMRSF